MKWTKKGKILPGAALPGWAESHASLPIALWLEGGRYRIYFSSRDALRRSVTGFVELDIQDPSRVLYASPEPILGPGELGAFDDSGAMASWLTLVGSSLYLYYIGWNVGVTVPFRNAIGLAISDDGGRRFHRYAAGPVLDRGPDEPFFAASPCVLLEGGVFRMWYLSCAGWEQVNGKPLHRYSIRYAESADGIAWRRDPQPCVTFKAPSEYAISRPCVLRDRDVYRMWYSCRGERYRIGYAESPDGRTWVRKDQEVGIDVSAVGWDSDMVEYAFVFDHDGCRYMLYNGNGYGETGIGLAVLESGLDPPR